MPDRQTLMSMDPILGESRARIGDVDAAHRQVRRRMLSTGGSSATVCVRPTVARLGYAL
jgi:hypothetical protein